jgi:DUF971 family protein
MALMQPRSVRDEAARNAVVIQWTDGHTSVLPYQVLRGWCPCAECQGHGGRLRWQEVKPVTFVKVEPVGTYGAQFTWSDMHALGIYRFDYLRDLCCCEECAGRRGGQPPVPKQAGA